MNGIDVRQIVVSLPAGYFYRGNNGTWQVPPGGGALQITAPLTGVNEELRHLALALWLIVLVGITVAVMLGLGVGRAVLGPLNELTGTVEELAETTDVSERLDPGGPDELGRLRRAFNRLLAALDTSRESQRQLVLDASHELRTPLTSLRTNMEVARRLEELAPEEREVLISDVLTQLDELTTLVADLAELARGQQPGVHHRTDPARLDRARGGGGGHHPRSEPGGRLRGPGGSDLGIGIVDPHRPGRGQPARQRPQVESGWWRGGGGLLRRHGDRARSRSRCRRQRRQFHLRPLLSSPRRPIQAGSGLGLAIVAQVARDEGGSVNAYHAQGGGALFRFSLPEVSPPLEVDPED